MKSTIPVRGSTRRLLAGEALAAMAQRGSHPSATELPRPEAAPDSPMRPGVPAAAALRGALAHELASVRGGIAIAADLTRSVGVRLDGLHQARRGLKRMQALSSLAAESELPATRWGGPALRMAKASLADTRQRDALARLLEELCPLKGNPLTAIEGASSVCALGAAPFGSLGDAVLAVERVAQATRIPAGAPLDWHTMAGAIGQRWKASRKASRSHWLGRGDEWLHGTRKRFQRLADQLTALREFVDGPMRRSCKRLVEAAEQLGRARDLGLLAEAVDRSTPEGKALARRALSLRSQAIRRARSLSRSALARSDDAVVRVVQCRAGITKSRVR